MVKLHKDDVQTKEVLSWKGVHLFHAQVSSCSQKLRVYLDRKGIAWTSHPVNVVVRDHEKPYFMGINPRGLVPALVHDGEVHIESNDIILHLEKAFPEPTLVPAASMDEMQRLLKHEDDLHLDLRTVTLGFLLPPQHPPKSQEQLDQYAKTGSGTVEGKQDNAKQLEIRFYRYFLEGGLPLENKKAAVGRFAEEFRKLNKNLARHPYLYGDTLTVLDIAWLVYTQRLVISGYPLERLHPNLWDWYLKLIDEPGVLANIALPDEIMTLVRAHQEKAQAEGSTISAVCGL